MKNKIKVTALLVVFSCLLFSTATIAQKSEKTAIPEVVSASISEDFVISLPNEQGAFSANYLLSVKNLQFKSEENLNKFCEMFSFDFHKLKGDFNNQKIMLELDRQSIERRGFSKVQVNQHFASISKRMEYYFQKFIN
jgi:hypothetical protein